MLCAVPAFSPYAFIVVVSTSTEVFMDVNPPVASAFAVATNSTDFDTSTPADIALYVAAATSSAAIPVSVLNFMIADDISVMFPLYDTDASPAIVLTCAIAVSKLIAASAVLFITPCAETDTGRSAPPTCLQAVPTADALELIVAEPSLKVFFTSAIACFATLDTVFLPITISSATAPTL